MPEHLPLVSIFIPTYNAERTIKDTLLSLLDQTYPNIEIHVVDNASTDKSVAIAESLQDRRILIHKYDIHVGGNESFSRCIKLACGDYTAIFHADDLYDPQIISTQVNWLEANPTASVVFTEATLVNESAGAVGFLKLPSSLRKINGVIEFPTLFRAILKHSNFLVCPSAMVKTSVYRLAINELRGSMFNSAADLDLWLRLSKYGGIGIIPKKLMYYRISQAQYSAQVRLQTNRSDFFRVTDYYLNLPEVAKSLNKNDLDNLEILEIRDKAMRSVNCVLTGEVLLAKVLLTEVLCTRNIGLGYKSKRALGVTIVAISLWLLLILSLNNFAAYIFGRAKQVMNK